MAATFDSVTGLPTDPTSDSYAYPESRRSDQQIVIVGAGVAGCALAYSLSQVGRNVLLIERDMSIPDRIVGELLQPGGCDILRQLGMGDCLEGIDAVEIEGYCCDYDGKTVQIPYPMEGEEGPVEDRKENAKRIKGRAFHHGSFINNLRQKVKTADRVKIVEGTVKSLVEDKHTGRITGVKVNVKSASTPLLEPTPSAPATPAEETTFLAPLVVIADGCFSKFRSPVSPKPVLISHFVGLVLKNAVLPIPKHGTVLLSGATIEDDVTGESISGPVKRGPVLCYQIGDKAEETRILIDIKGKLPSAGNGDLKAYIQSKIVPSVPEALRPSILAALEDQRIRVMPNSYLPPAQQGTSSDREGCFVVGDAWNMRHPLTGGGMTVAFYDCLLLTKILAPPALRDQLDGDVLDDWDQLAGRLKKWHYDRKKLSVVINVLSIALYDLFGADDPDLEVLQRGCFQYFNLGGSAISGPVSLLSAMAPKPTRLFYHFFCVAFYSIWGLFMWERFYPTKGELKSHGITRAPSYLEWPYLFLRSFHVFYTACRVLLPKMYSEMT